MPCLGLIAVANREMKLKAKTGEGSGGGEEVVVGLTKTPFSSRLEHQYSPSSNPTSLTTFSSLYFFKLLKKLAHFLLNRLFLMPFGPLFLFFVPLARS